VGDWKKAVVAPSMAITFDDAGFEAAVFASVTALPARAGVEQGSGHTYAFDPSTNARFVPFVANSNVVVRLPSYA